VKTMFTPGCPLRDTQSNKYGVSFLFLMAHD
jgi:hypothetical protein